MSHRSSRSALWPDVTRWNLVSRLTTKLPGVRSCLERGRKLRCREQCGSALMGHPFTHVATGIADWLRSKIVRKASLDDRGPAIAKRSIPSLDLTHSVRNFDGGGE